MSAAASCRLRILPEDIELSADTGQSVLEALIANGIFLRADCGGKGRCGKCLIQIVDPGDGSALPLEDGAAEGLPPDLLNKGFRLACQILPAADMTIVIPESSRQIPEVGRKGPILLPDTLPPPKDRSSEYGLAIDLGTTTIAVYLCNLRKGIVSGTVSVRNPQAIFGDDVMSRIGAVARTPETLSRLQRMAVQAIDWAALSLCRSAGMTPEQIASGTVVGNTTMIHLLLGESPASIGMHPYEPRFVAEKTVLGKALGFAGLSSMELYSLPLISGFLGSDILAAALAVDLSHAPVGTMLVDVGTNGEVMFVGEEGMLATSCATGPAFEGATIRHGMHAVSGAISSVSFDASTRRFDCTTIQKRPQHPVLPSGICGTGVISAVAECCRSGLLSLEGRLDRKAASDLLTRPKEGLPELVLVPSEDTRTRDPITLTQKDIRAIQLAKGALLTGMDLLCRHGRRRLPDALLVAGAFGSYIDKTDAFAIGMFPPLPSERLRVVGNAAGAGAILALFDGASRKAARKLASATTVVDLAARAEFQTAFLSALNFPSS